MGDNQSKAKGAKIQELQKGTFCFFWQLINSYSYNEITLSGETLSGKSD